MKHFNSKSWFFALLAIMTLASACHRETIYLENDGKQIRDKQNKFIGTWVRCGSSSLSDGECTCDTNYTGPIDTLIFTKDSLSIFSYNDYKFEYDFTNNFLIAFEAYQFGTNYCATSRLRLNYWFYNNDEELLFYSKSPAPPLSYLHKESYVRYKKINE